MSVMCPWYKERTFYRIPVILSRVRRIYGSALRRRIILPRLFPCVIVAAEFSGFATMYPVRYRWFIRAYDEHCEHCVQLKSLSIGSSVMGEGQCALNL